MDKEKTKTKWLGKKRERERERKKSGIRTQDIKRRRRRRRKKLTQKTKALSLNAPQRRHYLTPVSSLFVCVISIRLRPSCVFLFFCFVCVCVLGEGGAWGLFLSPRQSKFICLDH